LLTQGQVFTHKLKARSEEQARQGDGQGQHEADRVAIIASGLAMGKPNLALNGPELRTSKPAASPTTAAGSK
jgi:hypothetical protein